jgi:xanthine dehydrogenase YagS FAD-binding subunit
MQAFEYANPTTVREAVGMLGARWGEVDVLAGGTDLLSLMKEHIETPRRVVNIKNIKELGGIRSTAPECASAPPSRSMNWSGIPDPRYFRCWPRRRAGVSSPQMRNMGTVAGDLCQRPRCWYYRNGFGLLGQDKDGKPLIPAARISITPSWATAVRLTS